MSLAVMKESPNIVDFAFDLTIFHQPRKAQAMMNAALALRKRLTSPMYALPGVSTRAVLA